MKKGTCPKCNSQEVYKAPSNLKISIGEKPVTWCFAYICANCGYNEEYIENPKDLSKIRKKCKKVE